MIPAFQVVIYWLMGIGAMSRLPATPEQWERQKQARIRSDKAVVEFRIKLIDQHQERLAEAKRREENKLREIGEMK